MLIIRDAQMDKFWCAMRESLAQKIFRFIRDDCVAVRAIDGTTLPENKGELLDLVRFSISLADEFGVDSEIAYASFVLLSLNFARNFYELPIYSEIMKNAARSPNENVKCAMREAIAYGFGDANV